MGNLLTADQMQQVFKARPDVEQAVAATKQNAIRETTKWWEKFGVNELGNSFFDAGQAYSAPNITAAATAPAPRPDDLLGIRTSIYGELGIPQMQTEQQGFYNQLLNFDTKTERDQLGIMNETKSLGLLKGEAAQQQQQRDFGRSSIARSLEAVNNRLSTAMSEADTRFGIRSQEVQDVKNLMLQFPDAGIGFGDTTEAMANKIKKSNERKTVVDMFTQTFGYFPEGMSMDAMNKKLAKKYKSDKAYKEAKSALAFQNIQSIMNDRIADNARQELKDAESKGKEEQDRVSKEVDARSKFLDSIVQTYMTKYNKERRQSKKDAIKAEARKQIEARYPGWGWVSNKID